MLAEYGFHFSSWSRDLTAYETDTVVPAFPGLDLYQLDLQTVELHGALTEQNSQEEWNILVEDDTSSFGTSHLSSDLDEDIHTECNAMGEERIDKFVGANCFVNNVQEMTGQDGASLTGVELLDSVLDIHIPVNNSVTISASNDDGLPKSSLPASIPTLPTSPSKRPRKIDHIPWSELTYCEQQTLLESISVTVSDVLGPREQLVLLRIIDPDVQTLPLNGEFTIKPHFLDNEKLEKIHKLIASNTVSSRTSLCASTTNSTQEQPHSTSPKSSQKKKQTKERRSQLKAIRQQQRKEYKQNRKEKLSGLFQKEEVLALQNFKEEEEVDILG